MATKIGINGFGRIGRQVFKAILERHPSDLEVVAVNDLADSNTNAHLLKYDTNYGRFPGTVVVSDGNLVVNERAVRVFSERDPAQIPWGEVGAELVIESTGIFTQAERAAAHIHDTVRKVVISAPATGEDLTIVLGVNEDKYDPSQHNVLSNASCTTNCVAPMAKVLHEAFGIEKALMSTVHAYTNDQRTLDVVHSDLRRARAAAENIIPTTTGAARAVGIVLPELNGKIHGLAYRVPVPTGSIIDLTATLDIDATAEEINAAFRAAAEGPLLGILQVCDEPLVSSDFKEDPHSCSIDSGITMSLGGNMVKVMGWYDNEWGYSCRTADLCAFLAAKGL